jgi:transketolase C-terminal domain/subunit
MFMSSQDKFDTSRTAPESKAQLEELAEREKHPTQRDPLVRIAAVATPVKVNLGRRRFLVGSAMAGLGGVAAATIHDGERIYQDPGLRFVFSTRAPAPDILDIEGKPLYLGRPFDPGKDYIVRESPEGAGYVIATGETVYRALDAVISLQEQGVKVGLVNKPSVNVVDADMMKTLSIAPFVLVAEGWNVKTGLGSRFGSYLLQAGFRGRYNHVGTHKEGSAGQWQQMGYQGLDPRGIAAAIEALL